MSFSAFYQSPIGLLQLTAADEFITGINFLDKTEVPAPPPTSNKVLRECIRQLDDYFSGKKMQFHFPIQQQGTDFQQKVWAELTRISAGKTISYLELSKRLGNTKTIRAAGTANGKNNIAIAVPCHRVIGSNGSLVGYAGGLWRKKWLLNHEAKFCNGQQLLF